MNVLVKVFLLGTGAHDSLDSMLVKSILLFEGFLVIFNLRSIRASLVQLLVLEAILRPSLLPWSK